MFESYYKTGIFNGQRSGWGQLVIVQSYILYRRCTPQKRIRFYF